MFWRLLLALLSPFYALVHGLLPDDRDRQILALRQQVLILQRQVGKRPHLSRGQRLALLVSSRGMTPRQLLCTLLIAKSATVLPGNAR